MKRQASTGSRIIGSSLKKAKFVAGWARALDQYCLDPEAHIENVVVSYNDTVVIIKDQYPKARHHFLVMPRILTPRGVSSLCKADLPLLRILQKASVSFVNSKDVDGSAFNIGFHAVPSMTQLHVHVISRDFDSVCLKNKKHWNSFTTRFFIPLSAVIDEIEVNGSLEWDEREYETMLRQPMRCPVCSIILNNIPTAKEHHKSCFN